MYCFEIETNAKSNRSREIGVIVDDNLFVIEDVGNESRWNSDRFMIWHIPTDNPYTQKSILIHRERMTTANTVVEAKQKIVKHLQEYPGDYKRNEQAHTCPVSALPGGDDSDFYPTPMALAGKMIACVKWDDVRSILEPSAGKGDLVKAVEKMVEATRYRDRHTFPYKLQQDTTGCFDVIESDYNLRLLLRGQGLRLVHDDFLSFATAHRYDLIVMNPPFSAGAKHLLKAISLMEHGGQIVCLLNAETIRNPYTNERKVLANLLAEYNARIEFVRNGFSKAERKTDVEVAIVYLDIPKKRNASSIFENAQKAVEVDIGENRKNRDEYLIVTDEVEAMIQQYMVEAKAGIKLLEMFDELAPYIMTGNETYDKPLIQVAIHDRKYENVDNEVVNTYLKDLRLKYWKAFLNRPQLQRQMTSAMSSEYADKICEMSKYEFNKHNIAQVLFDIQSQLVQGVEDSLVELFDKLSSRYCTENEKNIHYYNGWRTNQAHAVGMKAIIPINGFGSFSWNKGQLDEYQIANVIDDLEKSMHYLDKGEIGLSYDVIGAIRAANDNGATNIHLSYFDAKFYKKGTCHILFHDDVKPIIERLNIFAGRKKNWLPPSYGKKRYQDMDADEQAVVDAFQGADAYNKVMANPQNYIIDSQSLRQLLTA